jgi:riboflavin biosynthesis pyrimidine reductase
MLPSVGPKLPSVAPSFGPNLPLQVVVDRSESAAGVRVSFTAGTSRRFSGAFFWRSSSASRLRRCQNLCDPAKAVEAVKRRQDLVILGCGELIQSLLGDGLVDQYILLIHPLVLGSGRRLFPNNGTVAKLQLTDSVTTSTLRNPERQASTDLDEMR